KPGRGAEGQGPGGCCSAGGRVGPLPDWRGTVSARRLGTCHELLQRCSQRRAFPFLGPVLPRGLSPQSAALGGGAGGLERVSRPAAGFRLGLLVSELCQRKVAGLARGRGRLSESAPAQPE